MSINRILGSAVIGIACVGSVLAGGSHAFAGIILYEPTEEHFKDLAVCPHGSPGATDLMPLEFHSASQMSADWTSILDQQINEQFPSRNHWHTILNVGMAGELEVVMYVARDGPPPLAQASGKCQHGADFEAYFLISGGLASGQHFAWLQAVSITGPGGPEVWEIDPEESEIIDKGTKKQTMDRYPFYDNYADTASSGAQVPAETDWILPDGLYTFVDHPEVEIKDRPPHSGQMNLHLFLVSWDEAYNPTEDIPEDIQVYGYLDWGFSYYCIPEPSSLTLFAVMGLLGLNCRRV